MGVNCKVTLNAGADWKKVGQVACVLLGAKATKTPFDKHDGYHVLVDGFDNRESKAEAVAARLLGQEPFKKYRATWTPEYIDIMVQGAQDNPVAKSIAETDGSPYALWYGLENRILYPTATAAKIALAEGLTKFFGGKITYNDSTGYEHTFRSRLNFKNMDDNAVYYLYQDALLALKPLSQKDLDRLSKHAAY